MRTLLDENVPAELFASFQTLQAVHVEEIGHKGAKNGEFLSVARSGYELLITFDKGLPYQHSHKDQSLRILVLRLTDNKKKTVLQYAPRIEMRLGTGGRRARRVLAIRASFGPDLILGQRAELQCHSWGRAGDSNDRFLELRDLG